MASYIWTKSSDCSIMLQHQQLLYSSAHPHSDRWLSCPKDCNRCNSTRLTAKVRIPVGPVSIYVYSIKGHTATTYPNLYAFHILTGTAAVSVMESQERGGNCQSGTTYAE